VGTWEADDPAYSRPIAAPLEKCAELLGVNLTTIQRAASDVEPYIRVDGTKVWSLMQLERRLALRHTAGFEVATSAADGVRQSTAKPPPHCRSRREVRPSSGPECEAGAGSVGRTLGRRRPARRPLAQLLPRRVVGHPGAGTRRTPDAAPAY
jgi:hypothetical protein